MKWDNASFCGHVGLKRSFKSSRIVSGIKKTLHKQKLLLLSLIFTCIEPRLAYMWQNKAKGLMIHIEKL